MREADIVKSAAKYEILKIFDGNCGFLVNISRQLRTVGLFLCVIKNHSYNVTCLIERGQDLEKKEIFIDLL